MFTFWQGVAVGVAAAVAIAALAVIAFVNWANGLERG